MTTRIFSQRTPTAILAARLQWCTHSTTAAPTIQVGDRTFIRDDHTNVPSHILAALGRKLHLQPAHPLATTRQLIERRFPGPVFTAYNELSPVVTVGQNFDSLGFPTDHAGRSRSDTYYINRDTVLRTHTSAHQGDTFRTAASAGFTIAADVYRRDAIDRSHYPVFHQIEGARMWSRRDGDLAAQVHADLARLPTQSLVVEDEAPLFHASNPLQDAHHSKVEASAITAHLKRSLEGLVAEVFGHARVAAAAASEPALSAEEPLRVRWIDATFPFTSPSWELEVFWQGAWLELLGCGVVRQSLLINADVPDQAGWAFGVGLERVAMLLFGIPDIRLFWSRDSRFLTQFQAGCISRFVPFSKHPPCYKDVAFWLPTVPVDTTLFHGNDIMELVHIVAGDCAEDVSLVDQFVHPKTSRKSLCWRINYRSLERTLTNEETNAMHDQVGRALVERYGVELR